MKERRASKIYIFFGNKIESTIEETRANNIIPRDTTEEMCTPKIPDNILSPMNNRIKARPFCR